MKARGFTKAEEIAQWGTAFTANPGDLSLILGLYGGRRHLTSENCPLTSICEWVHGLTCVCVCVYTHTLRHKGREGLVLPSGWLDWRKSVNGPFSWARLSPLPLSSCLRSSNVTESFGIFLLLLLLFLLLLFACWYVSFRSFAKYIFS